MRSFQIQNRHSGHILGIYEGDDEDEALDAMARDAGYDDREQARDVTGAARDDLVVTEVEPDRDDDNWPPPARCLRTNRWGERCPLEDGHDGACDLEDPDVEILAEQHYLDEPEPTGGHRLVRRGNTCRVIGYKLEHEDHDADLPDSWVLYEGLLHDSIAEAASHIGTSDRQVAQAIATSLHGTPRTADAILARACEQCGAPRTTAVRVNGGAGHIAACDGCASDAPAPSRFRITAG